MTFVISCYLSTHDKKSLSPTGLYLSVVIELCWKILGLMAVKSFKKIQKYFLNINQS